MNDLPAFTDHSRALEYRTNILTFNNSYVGREDRTLKHKLRQEAGLGKLINFALQGLASLYKGRDFIVPVESAMTMNTFRELVSPIVEFADNCLGSVENNGVPADYLYDLWKWWCKREGRNAGFKSTFIRNLLSNMTNALQIREGEVGNMDRVIMGVKVTDWAEKEYMKGE
jgi:putative DNA primase/helicase